MTFDRLWHLLRDLLDLCLQLSITKNHDYTWHQEDYWNCDLIDSLRPRVLDHATSGYVSGFNKILTMTCYSDNHLDKWLANIQKYCHFSDTISKSHLEFQNYHYFHEWIAFKGFQIFYLCFTTVRRTTFLANSFFQSLSKDRRTDGLKFTISDRPSFSGPFECLYF